jgi:hypothetical protein
MDIYGAGETYPASWHFYYNQNFVPTATSLWYLKHINWGYVVDSVVVKQWKDSLLIGTNQRADVASYPDTSVTAYRGYRNEVDFILIPTTGDSQLTWKFVYDLRDTTTLPTIGAHTALVTVTVKNSNDSPMVNVAVGAYIARSNVQDSTGASISAVPQYHLTDALGQAHFMCIWSSYLVPFSLWRFTAFSPRFGGLAITDTVPRQSTWTLDLQR